jgi:putative tryptophan/tyrosine transport system substrate-binding protein
VKRREFITLVGGAAAAWPITARAQQGGKLPTVGVLLAGTRITHGQWADAFAQRLRELAWVDGHTINIEYRWAEGHDERED